MYRAIYSLGLAIALALSCSVGALAQTRDTIRLTNGDWLPFMSKNGPHHGVASHVITEAFALVGVEVKYGFFPWARSLKLAKEGIWDGSAAWWDREERYQYVFYSDPVAPTTVVFFHLKSTKFDWSTYEDLRKFRIGASRGYDYGKKPYLTSTLTDKLVAKYIIGSRIPDAAPDLEWLPPALHVETNYFAISRKAEDFNTKIADFNRGLAAIEADGTLEMIIAEHGF